MWRKQVKPYAYILYINSFCFLRFVFTNLTRTVSTRSVCPLQRFLMERSLRSIFVPVYLCEIQLLRWVREQRSLRRLPLSYILKQSCDSTLDYKEPFFSVYAHQRFVRKNNNPRFNFCIFAAYRWGLVVHYLWEEEGGILLGSHFQNLDWFWRVIFWQGSVACRVILINSMKVVQSSNEHELKLNETTVKIIHQS